MREKNALYELKILSEAKRELILRGRCLDYKDEKRVEEIRIFLDSLSDITNYSKEDEIEGEAHITKSEKNEVPF